jgi:hypothetical protein
MCNCNKYHLSGVTKGSINLRDALNNGYLIAALTAMGFNFKDSADWAKTQQDVLYELGRSAQMVYGAQIRAIAENINVLTAQFQVMNQALGLKETNPYILTATELKKSFLDRGLNINTAVDRDTWVRSAAPQFHQYIDMNETRKVLDSIPFQMNTAPNGNNATDQRPGTAGYESGEQPKDNKPMTKSAMALWGVALLAGGVLLYNVLNQDKPKYKGPALKGMSKAKKVVQTISF